MRLIFCKVAVRPDGQERRPYNLSNRVSIYKGDLFGPLENLGLENTIDAVICNPPYIASSRLKNDRAYLTAYEREKPLTVGRSVSACTNGL